jgi:histone H3/H4
MSTEVESAPETTKKGTLPVPRIDRALRKHFAGKRVSAGTSVYATAALEAIFAEVVRTADEKRMAAKGKAKRIDRKMLISAVRSNPALARLFRNYAFAPESAIKIKREALMTKADKEVAMKRRESEKQEKQEKQAVPGVDEE